MRTRQRRPYSSLAESFIGASEQLEGGGLTRRRGGAEIRRSSAGEPPDGDDVFDAERQFGGFAHAVFGPGRIEGELEFYAGDAGDGSGGGLDLSGEDAGDRAVGGGERHAD